MIQRSREWLAGLRDHVEHARRAAGPAGPAGRSAPSPAEGAAERMILASSLVVWLENEWPTLLAERRASLPPTADPDPAIVVTTSSVGISMVDDTLGRPEPLMASLRGQVVAVTEREYRDWTKAHPDPDHLLHVNHWSWVKTTVPEARRQEFARHPLAAGEAFWLHRTGTTGCGTERRFCHLWKWNGQAASLIQPFIEESVRRL
ncbi:MAG: hypothetical protein ACKOB1_09225 [Planctomycetia bacterium]